MYGTLELLASEMGDRELAFVMGADVAAGLERWREPERVVELARLAIAQRPGLSDSEIAARSDLGAAPSDDDRDAPVRDLLLGDPRAGGARQPFRYLVPDPVARLIADRRPSTAPEGGEALVELGGPGPPDRRGGGLEGGRPTSSRSTSRGSSVFYTDVLVICTARNERQVRAVAEEVQLKLKHDDKAAGQPGRGPPRGALGASSPTTSIASSTSSSRRLADRYSLEDLWHEAPRLDLGFDKPEARSAASA